MVCDSRQEPGAAQELKGMHLVLYQLLPFAFIPGKTYLQNNIEKQSKKTNLTVVNSFLAYFMLVSQ